MKRFTLAVLHLLQAASLAAASAVIDSRATTYQYLNKNSQPYLVNGNAIPNVTFDVGENYAGLMQFDTVQGQAQNLFFWFFPTTNPAGKNDFVIWFNGGPGCSSLEGFTQENGVFSWKPGTFAPTANAYSWHKLANVVWIEYPLGTGFSNGPVTAKNNDAAAQQIIKFWIKFSSTFDLHYKNIYLTGESYAGVHIPYIGSAMLNQKDMNTFNLKGAMMYDAVLPYTDGSGHDQVVFPSFARYWNNLFGMSPATYDSIQSTSQSCGNDAYLNKYLTYPPPPMPFPNFSGCDVLGPFFDAVSQANPCFNQYHVSDTCPIQWDIDGYPNMPYVPEGAKNWLNQADVRQALHIPAGTKDWNECSGPVYAGNGPGYDSKEHEKRMQAVIQSTNNVMVSSGLLDMVVPPNITALALQMLTWNGKQGFQTAPSADFVLPAAKDVGIPNLAGGGYQGSVHTERGVTYSAVKLAGHMVPQYAPSAALRQLEFLLGRVSSLSDGRDYTINISTNFKYPY